MERGQAILLKQPTRTISNPWNVAKTLKKSLFVLFAHHQRAIKLKTHRPGMTFLLPSLFFFLPSPFLSLFFPSLNFSLYLPFPFSFPSFSFPSFSLTISLSLLFPSPQPHTVPSPWVPHHPAFTCSSLFTKKCFLEEESLQHQVLSCNTTLQQAPCRRITESITEL